MVRAFIAIEAFNPELVRHIEAVQKRLSALPARISMVNPKNVHMTLKFLGETSEPKIEEARERLSQINQQRFTFKVSGLGFFPNVRRPRVVFLRVKEGGDTIRKLAEKVEDIFHGIGFPRERRAFSPHVTIARVKSPRSIGRIPDDLLEMGRSIDIAIAVDAIKLKKSTLTPKGPIYSDLYVKTLSD